MVWDRCRPSKNKSFPLHSSTHQEFCSNPRFISKVLHDPLALSHLKVHVLQQLGQPVSGLRYGVAFNVRSSAMKSKFKVSHANHRENLEVFRISTCKP